MNIDKTLPVHDVLKVRLHPYIRTFAAALAAVPDGICWSTPLKAQRVRMRDSQVDKVFRRDEKFIVGGPQSLQEGMGQVFRPVRRKWERRVHDLGRQNGTEKIALRLRNGELILRSVVKGSGCRIIEARHHGLAPCGERRHF